MFGRLLKTYGGIACCGLLALLLWWGWQDFHQTCRQIQEDVIRLHVLANSDSPSDQEIKLQVRDGVLKEVESIYRQGKEEDPQLDRQGMEALLESHQRQLEQAAREALEKAGADGPVTVELTDAFYTTRDYDTFTLPAGTYRSLQVVIGEGEGHNWWCVAFPPLCLPRQEEDVWAAFSPQETQVITHPARYQVRFAAVELWESLKNAWENR